MIYDSLVIGAGLSGLSAAYRLGQQGKSVLLVESAPSVGGLMQTLPDGPYLLETGPNSVPASATEFLTLAQEVGLLPLASSAGAKKRYLYLHKTLCALPTTPLQALTTPVLSFKGKIRFLAEPLVPGHCFGQEETMASFINRRFGREVLQNIVAPFLSGIYAGDPEKLSVDAVFPKLPEWEQRENSVLFGAIGTLLSKRKRKPKSVLPAGIQRSDLMSFSRGLGALPLALQQAMASTVTVKLQTQVTAIQFLNEEKNHYQVHCQTPDPSSSTPFSHTFLTRSLLLAVPASVSASLLEPLHPEVSLLLKEIFYVPIVVVQVAVNKKQISHSLDGFGCLLPRESGLKTLGIIWASSLFPERAPENEALFSCYVGGATYPEALSLSDEALEALVLSDLKTVFKSETLIPCFVKILRYPSAIPQYQLGHRPRIRHIKSLLQERFPNIQLAGNYLQGVSLNACIQSADSAVALLAKAL